MVDATIKIVDFKQSPTNHNVLFSKLRSLIYDYEARITKSRHTFSSFLAE